MRLAVRAACLVAGLPVLAGAPPASARPNIVIILTDDLGARDLAVDGSSFHRTPNLDRLARQGVRFTQATAASPVCSPTRASLFTGLHPARLGITDWIGAEPVTDRVTTPPNRAALPEDAPTLGEVFARAGYRTGYIGKWHLGDGPAHPSRRGFAWTFAVNGAGEPGSHLAPFKGRAPSPRDVPDLEGAAEGAYLADRLTDEAVAYLDRRDAQPFLLVLSHYAVHTPLQAPAALVEAQKGRAAGLPPVSDHLFQEPGGAWTRRRQDHPAYAAMVENLDANVGRLLRHLEARGLDRSTVVVFLSDNGGLSTLERRGNPATSNAPLRAGKGWLYEGGLRIPLLVRGPGIAAGSTRSDRIGTTDLMPTLLELAGLSPGPRLDGRSVVSALTGKALPAREQFWHFPHYHGSGSRPASAVRRGSLKLIQSLEDGRLQLFDLAKDPGETTDIAARRPREAARLLRILEAWRDRVKAQMPTR